MNGMIMQPTIRGMRQPQACSSAGLSTAVKAPYVGEKSTESGRILGKMIVDKLGGASAKGTVILGNCFPGFPVLENRAKGVEGCQTGRR